MHAHVHTLLHVPLDMGRQMLRQTALIKDAGAGTAHPIMLADDQSPWGTELYIEVTKRVPGAELQTISGTFLTKVFEGPYSRAHAWMREMERYVADKQRHLEKLYLGYTTCPRCAAAYGKNYVVLFAKVTGEATASNENTTSALDVGG